MSKIPLPLYDKFKIYSPVRIIEYSLSEIFNYIFYRLFRNSYSQMHEDMIIDQHLGNKKRGFYVDVGAHNPNRFSNTKRFYNKGWKGINIEPDPKNFEKFVLSRTRDINLNIGIGERASKITFYTLIPDTLSTFSKADANEYIKNGFKLVSKQRIQVDTLANVLDNHMKNRSKIDFFSIDTEGFDYKVLQSNNWKNYSPKIVCIESSNDGATDNANKIDKFLLSKGYIKVYENKLNSIYKLK